ncbi:DNA mismatch repair protein MutS [candidate division KSB3 bacterium]|uniref:DNA mismatch repair protein MutS n=1 Tax=candidate division KSB3 bacterium TaxID=2044937 RepID=A0A2G6E1T9_9BACT|nr:MAG: DNA mismatch repair protein MutS [candidate division KSB3 bacterium]PIE28637.1 MAG: DNA mismatch repair protein MutS [candidate division KSB3 bacterium]
MSDKEYFPEAVELPLEDVLDLHSFPPKEIKILLNAYLDDACEAGFPEVRIIHGKGIGVQREIVRSVASKHPCVASVRSASDGWGASIVIFADKNG